jgi:superkiller protein 3
MGYYLLGLDLRFNEAAFEEAERSYKQAVFLKEDCAEAHEQLGWLLYRRPERVPEAISHFRRAIVLKGDDWRDHFNLAFRLYRERTSDALVSIQDAIDALPAKSREKSSRAEKAFITGKLHFCCALMQFHQGSLKDADVSCEQAMRVLGVRLDKPIPNRVKTKKVGLSKVFAMRGYIKNAQQCFAEAIPCFEEALALDPEEAAAGHGLGDAYRKLSNYREALVAYQKDSAASWERDSNDMKHARYLGIAESALKGSEYDVAEKYFLRTIWKQHLRYDSYLGIGLARHGKRRFHEAVSAYKEASKSRPAAPEAYQGAVSAMVDAGAGVEAVRVHQAYLQSWGAPFGRTHSLASLIQNLQFAVVNPPIQDWFRDADFVIRKSKL